MKMVLNELSYQFPSSTIEEGKKIIKRFLILYNTGINIGLSDCLIIDRSLDDALLAPKYPIAKWRNDPTVDREIIRVYIRMNDKAESITDYLSEEHQLKEFICEKGASKGLMIASELDYVAISFLSDEVWDVDIINGTYIILDSNHEIYEEDRSVYHFSRKSHIDNNKNLIEKKLSDAKLGITDGQELWNKKSELFSNLLFCSSVKDQVYSINRGNPELNQIIKKLDILERYFSNWDGGRFERDKIPNADPESPVTLNRFQKEHEFTVPDGRDLVFSLHLRFTGGSYPGRIFFYPDQQTQKCIIGHIGGKLPTVKYPNP